MNVTKDPKSKENIYSNQEVQMMIVRNMELEKIKSKLDSLETSKTYIDSKTKIQLKKSLDYLENLAKGKVKTKEEPNDYDKTQAYITAIRENKDKVLNKLIDDEMDTPVSLEEYKNRIALAEVSKLYKKGSYNWFNNYWASAWGFYSLTAKDTYTALDSLHNFEPQKLKQWEFNLQMNGIHEKNNLISIYWAAGWKVFKNNSALADLMTLVDYYQYTQFPQTKQSNLAVSENDKAYIGEFRNFTTNNFNLKGVFSLSNTYADGEERLCTPGLSAYIEQNIGEYNAMNIRIGVPLRFRGKETPINIEPQIRLNNICNYKNEENFKLKPVIGINVGLPFTALFK